jgi:uncharacterized protein (TIGR03503 family)
MIKTGKKGFFLLLLTLLLQSLLSAPAWAGTATTTNVELPGIAKKDIRVVIDMSGSMKKNDPDNHRTKAVQLFSEILPQGISAGIWTFAADVNMLVKHQDVNKSWKRSAFKKATKIHSHGLYTNIEKALKISTRGLYKNDPTKEKHIILLTDGYIDIAKDAAINKASRLRVLNELLPRLHKYGIVVHSVALSEHADHELMKALSYKTGGQYAVIHKASDLDRYFFKLFQSTAKPDTVPLKSNRFDIDKSINDMTVVLFNNNHASKLISPDKKTWTYEKHPSSVKWVKSDNYELITVSKPAVGTWHLDAPIDPDNKIMVVTNLSLQVNKLPNQVLPGETLDIKIHMTEDNKVIEKDEFIKLVYVKTILKKMSSLARTTVKTEYKGKGIFSAQAETDKHEDKSLILITAKGPTFTREYRHEFTVVVNPVIIETKAGQDKDIAVIAYIDDRALDKDNIKIFIEDDHENKELKRVGVKWQVNLPESYSGKEINIKVEAKLHDGKTYNKVLHTTLPTINKKVVEDKHEHEKAEKPKEEANPADVVVAEEAADPEDVEKEGSSLNWIIVTGSVVLFNIVLIIAGYFLYKKFFKTETDDYLLLDDSVINASDDNTQGKDKQAGDSTQEDASDTLEDLDDIEDMEDLDDEIQEAGAK